MADFPEPRSKTLAEILTDLRKPISKKYIQTKRSPGNPKYVHHAHIRDLLDYFAPGWESELKIFEQNGKVHCQMWITIHGSDGSITRTNFGNEDNSIEAYGGPLMRASAQALRRTAMEFGLGRHLWRP